MSPRDAAPRPEASSGAARPGTGSADTTGGVKSVTRAMELLELMVQAGPEVALSELAERSGLPAPTTHRLMRTLLAHGYVRQLPSRRYALGPALIRLGDQAGRHLGVSARVHLEALAAQVGETVNLAMLDQDMVVYVGQAASRHSMRMFTEVGRRVHAHSTGVGKAVLAELTDPAARRILDRAGMPGATAHTITGAEEFLAELAAIRDRGYAIDDEEQEIGVRCVAVAVPGAPVPTAVSVSGPAARLDLADLEAVLPSLRRTAVVLSAFYSSTDPA